MEETIKSYNPFKMWGSWVGFGLGVLIIPLEDMVFILNPIIWLFLFVDVGHDIGLLIGLIAIFTLPIALFIYGWGIHSLFRKINREKLVYILPVILLIVASPITYAYIKAQQTFQALLKSADTNIQSAGALPNGAPRTGTDFNREALGMSSVMAIAKTEPDNSKLIDKMMSIARDESIAIDVRLTALESLTPRVSTMSSVQKKSLGGQLVLLSDQVSKSTQLDDTDKERMTGRITRLQKLLTTN